MEIEGIEVIEVYKEEETYNLGFKMGQMATEGSIIALNGDLGVGKTIFTKGFGKGLDVEEHITSPTFTIVNEYLGRIPFFHFDLYRLTYDDEMYDIGYEEYFYGKGVCLVEWAERFPDLIPKETTYITIEKDYSKSDDYRKIKIEKSK